jgi:drug/metabolite transporter (DMT)-like permease
MDAPSLPEDQAARRRNAALPYVLLTLCMLFWAGNWVVGRAIRNDLPPVALNFWRWLLAALLLAPYALPRLRGKGALLRRNWRVLAALSFLGMVAFQCLVYTGLRQTTAINAVLMNSALPLAMIVIVWLANRQPATPRQFLGVALSLLGILIIMNRGDLGALRHFNVNRGDLIILAAMPVWGVYSVLLQRRPSELDGLTFLFVAALFALPVLAPLHIAEALLIQAPVLSWSAVGAVLYVGVFASVGAYVCWNRGVDLVGPNKAGFTYHLLPAFGTVLAVIFLGEEVHLFHVVGIATILAGVWLATAAPAGAGRG